MGAHPANLRAVRAQRLRDSTAPSHASPYPPENSCEAGAEIGYSPAPSHLQLLQLSPFRAATKSWRVRYCPEHRRFWAMYPNQDAIFERLETTKRFGLLSDYLVSWTGRP